MELSAALLHSQASALLAPSSALHAAYTTLAGCRDRRQLQPVAPGWGVHGALRSLSAIRPPRHSQLVALASFITAPLPGKFQFNTHRFLLEIRLPWHDQLNQDKLRRGTELPAFSCLRPQQLRVCLSTHFKHTEKNNYLITSSPLSRLRPRHSLV